MACTFVVTRGGWLSGDSDPAVARRHPFRADGNGNSNDSALSHYSRLLSFGMASLAGSGAAEEDEKLHLL